MENMTHPDILNAERYGLPEGHPETRECSACGRKYPTDTISQCEECEDYVCDDCKVEFLDKTYCSIYCADDALRIDFIKLQQKNDLLKKENDAMQNDMAMIYEYINKLWQFRQDNIPFLQRPQEEPGLFGIIRAKTEWWVKRGRIV